MVLKFNQYKKINESVKLEQSLIELPIGTKLFHGTGENFDTDLKISPYDKVLWTADNSVIAQSYIPTSGLSMYISTKGLIGPTPDKTVQAIQRSLGIHYDYNNINFKGFEIKGGYQLPEIFREISDNYSIAFKKYYDTEKKLKELEKTFVEYTNLPFNEIDEEVKDKMYNEIKKLYIEVDKLKNEYYESNDTKLKCKLVNDILVNKFGYKPENYGNDNDGPWKLKYNREGLLKSDYKQVGRLFILTAKEPIKILDTTDGGKREADLLDVDYHKLEWFRYAEKNGYDGIKITDFSQTEEYGNYEHTSIGIFKNSINKFSYISIPATHPNINNAYKNDYKTPEYIEYLNTLN